MCGTSFCKRCTSSELVSRDDAGRSLESVLNARLKRWRSLYTSLTAGKMNKTIREQADKLNTEPGSGNQFELLK